MITNVLLLFLNHSVLYIPSPCCFRSSNVR